jgi:phosphoglycolate phosphatase-like HAD superfamily hydrolase
MKAKIRHILEECIESGVAYGYVNAHKHMDDPPEDHIFDRIEHAIWLEIDEHFEFDRDVVSEVEEGFDHLEKARSDEINVELIEEHDDGSATYRFNLTEKYADALLQNGILWAIVSGVTGVTIDKVLQDHAKNDDHLNLAYELGYEAAKRELSSKS